MLKDFIYIQTRLQARHGMRPDNQEWQILESQKDLAAFLHSARHTRLKPWVLSLHASDNHHVLETTLRQLYCNYVDEVEHWMPSVWQASVRWVKYLHYLPSLQYLLSGNIVYAWMLEDPQLKELTGTNVETRIQILRQSAYAPLIDPWQSGKPLLTAWTEHWRSLWPDQNNNRSINKLISSIDGHLFKFGQISSHPGRKSREIFTAKLSILFRQFSYQPVAVFIHLALIALDVERLRSNILQRCLFDRSKVVLL
ncbi:MAG: hypothetical protein AB4040_19205 [Synechococcus sp.]